MGLGAGRCSHHGRPPELLPCVTSTTDGIGKPGRPFFSTGIGTGDAVLGFAAPGRPILGRVEIRRGALIGQGDPRHVPWMRRED